MKFLCPKCQAAYQVADDRLSAGTRLRCKRCDTVFALEQAQPLSGGAKPAAASPLRTSPPRPRSMGSVGGAATARLASDAPPSFGVLAKQLEPTLVSNAPPKVSAAPPLTLVHDVRASGAPDFDPFSTTVQVAPLDQPPSLFPSQFSAPRVPNFAATSPAAKSEPVSGPQLGAGPPKIYPDSLAPGASVWPARLKESRHIPVHFAGISGAVCLGVGFLLGFLTFRQGHSSAVVQETDAAAQSSLAAAALPSHAAPAPPPSAVPELAASSPAPKASAEQSLPTAAELSAHLAASKGTGKQKKAENESELSGKAPAVAGPAAAHAAESSDENAETALGDRLSGGEIQRTVYRYQPSVRHSCWQRQLARRDPASVSTARVSITLTISPAGKVTKVSASPDPPGYDGLSQCITGKVKSWAFPKAQSSTTAQIPFTFAAQ